MKKHRLFVCALAAAASSIGACTTEKTANERVEMRLDAFAAASGEEGLRCQTFVNPLGRDIDIVGWTSRLSRSGHHMLVWIVDDAKPSALGPCAEGGGSFAPIFQGQEAGEASLAYPDGVAVKLGARQGLGIQIHYLNAGRDPVEIANVLELSTAEPSASRRALQPLRYENLAIRIPARAPETTLSKSCKLPRDVDLVTLVGHVHNHGRRFKVTALGETLYETTSTEPPMKVFASPHGLRAQTQIDFACSYASDPNRDIGPETSIMIGRSFTRDLEFFAGFVVSVPTSRDVK